MDAGSIGYGVEDMRILDQGSRISDLKRAERAAKAKAASSGQIDEAAQEFEAVFLSQMLQHMFAGVDMNPMAEDGTGKEIYESMLVDEYAKMIVRTGGIGLADQVKREMLKLQETDDGTQNFK
jgi:peptidoglycan hydrolase FlgJ